ncbi:MAG: Rrf2 family transcriptional regulator [Planctomycetes bacterium]|nr:Rrf2 family transcriptional regulator [Planctomycetota bacterium]
MYGKQTERAISALSYLAEVWDGGKTRLSAVQIAQERSLPKAMVAKILTTLSQAGLVVGSTGPGGGYALAKPPIDIKFHQVFELFERENKSHLCPFGGGVCGVGENCALHDSLVATQVNIRKFLQETTFEIFRHAAQIKGLKPSKPTVIPETPRESFRARGGAKGG